MDKVIFYTDEDVKTSIATGLNRLGIKAFTARDTNNLGLKDEEQLKYAIKNNFVLITHDDDFLILANKYNHKGIIYVHQNKYNIGGMINELKMLYDVFDQKEMENRLEFL